MAEQREQRVRRHPRMSLNALAQYMSANAPDRESILRKQKFPPTFQVIWYRDALRAITRFLHDPTHDVDVLAAAEQRLRAAPAGARAERQKLNDNVNAIAAFRACCGDITFDRLVAARPPQESHLSIEGVTISVRPEAILSGQYRGAECNGGVKVYLSKNDRLTDNSANAVASLLYRYVERLADNGERPSTRHCIVVDAFGHSCTCAPRAITRRQREIDAACREIAFRWPAI